MRSERVKYKYNKYNFIVIAKLNIVQVKAAEAAINFD